MRNQKTILFALILLSVVALTTQVQAQESIPAPPDVATPPEEAEVTASGLASKVLAPGTGT